MSAILIPGMAEQPERRYTYAGRVAHLHAYGTDFGVFPYSFAYCGLSPRWGSAWLGSGSQCEADLAASLPLCKRCAVEAKETADFIADLARSVGYVDAPATEAGNG